MTRAMVFARLFVYLTQNPGSLQEYLSVHEKLDPGYNKWKGRIMEEMSTPYIISQLTK